MKATLGRSVPVALYLSMILVPLLFAVDRLMFVTGMNPFQAIFHLDEHPLGTDAIMFTFAQAISFCTSYACPWACPLHGGLGRYEWKNWNHSSRIDTPIVTPTVVAAMGFLALIKEGWTP